MRGGLGGGGERGEGGEPAGGGGGGGAEGGGRGGPRDGGMIVGTAGHIDHGKTALVKALRPVSTPIASRRRRAASPSISGYAYSDLGDGRQLGFVDVPGHERFVHNMLAGATGIDAALLVVSAAEGIKPQTVEHLQIIDLLGLDRGVVALTKADLATTTTSCWSAWPRSRRCSSATSLQGAEIVPVSATDRPGRRRAEDQAAGAGREPQGRAAASRGSRSTAASCCPARAWW